MDCDLGADCSAGRGRREYWWREDCDLAVSESVVGEVLVGGEEGCCGDCVVSSRYVGGVELYEDLVSVEVVQENGNIGLCCYGG